MARDLKVIPVIDIFMKYNYIVPIYQRNYAWVEEQIEQLIEDIDGAISNGKENYFLGNLIVNQADNNLYEVIDGQQRLTTLYLLERFLGLSFTTDALRFEAREKYARTLKSLSESNGDHLLEELTAKEITRGFQIINDYFNYKQLNKTEFCKKLKNVFLVMVQVPKNIDLNHYFEIMNTRGEQLELHEIAKAKLLEVLSNDDEKKAAAEIWDKCSDMNSYVQMNFEPSVRNNLFTDDWSSLKSTLVDFDAVKDKIIGNIDNAAKKTLQNILEENKLLNLNDSIKDEIENERFESTISFPNFLLQVNAVVRELGEEDSSLDDKNFLANLSWAWSSSEKAKEFLYYLLNFRTQ